MELAEYAFKGITDLLPNFLFDVMQSSQTRPLHVVQCLGLSLCMACLSWYPAVTDDSLLSVQRKARKRKDLASGNSLVQPDAEPVVPRRKAAAPDGRLLPLH